MPALMMSADFTQKNLKVCKPSHLVGQSLQLLSVLAEVFWLLLNLHAHLCEEGAGVFATHTGAELEYDSLTSLLAPLPASADCECATCIPRVARLGQARPAHHLGFISRQQPMCRKRRISVKHDVIDIFAIEVAASHSHSGILVLSFTSLLPRVAPSLSRLLVPSLCASARGHSAASI